MRNGQTSRIGLIDGRRLDRARLTLIMDTIAIFQISPEDGSTTFSSAGVFFRGIVPDTVRIHVSAPQKKKKIEVKQLFLVTIQIGVQISNP